MGVDIGCYLIYGINTGYRVFVDENDYDEEDISEYQTLVKQEDVKNYNLKFRDDCYSSNWGVVGIDIFDNDAEKFAENVRTAPQKFKEFADKYNIDLEKYKPGFDLDAYYW